MNDESLLNQSISPSAFAALGLSAPALDAVARLDFKNPTPIQQQAIPPALEGRDVIGCAATGTGKTAAFLLPILDRLSGRRGTRALVLAPTRELTLQIMEQVHALGANRGVRGAAIIGGAGMGPQVRELREERLIVVATPGRLIDHLERGTARLDGIEVLVLDEADRMLDMGFRRQLDAILARVPRKRQTMLFSATMAGEVADFARRNLHDPVRVEVARSGTVARGATQLAYHVNENDKPALLLALLASDDASTLIFTRTQHRTDRLAKILARAGHKVARIHGGRSQPQRRHALEGFRAGDYRILVATDIAARGLDVAGIGHVVAYDLSASPEDHVHRVGRTARAEAVGRASSLVAPAERSLFRDIERFTRSTIDSGQLPNDLREWNLRIEQARHQATREADAGDRRAPAARSRRGRPGAGGFSSPGSRVGPGHAGHGGHGGGHGTQGGWRGPRRSSESAARGPGGGARKPARSSFRSARSR